jgi:hypothetical protein
MIIITLLAVISYLIRIVAFLNVVELHTTVTLPDVDTTILATFGLGQGAYLAKKFVSDAGGGKESDAGGGKPSDAGGEKESVAY